LSHSHFFQKFSSTLKTEYHKSRLLWLFSNPENLLFGISNGLYCHSLYVKFTKLLPLVDTQITFLFLSGKLSYGVNLFRGEWNHYLRWNRKPDLLLPLRAHY
jgi:hypothetical protein